MQDFDCETVASTVKAVTNHVNKPTTRHDLIAKFERDTYKLLLDRYGEQMATELTRQLQRGNVFSDPLIALDPIDIDLDGADTQELTEYIEQLAPELTTAYCMYNAQLLRDFRDIQAQILDRTPIKPRDWSNKLTWLKLRQKAVAALEKLGRNLDEPIDYLSERLDQMEFQ